MDAIDQIHHFLNERFSLSSKGIRLTGDSLLLEERIIDSIGMLELLLFVEETFDVEFPDQDIVPENLGTINKLAAYIDKNKLSVDGSR